MWDIRGDQKESRRVLEPAENAVSGSDLFKGDMDHVTVKQNAADLDQLRRWQSTRLARGAWVKLFGVTVTLVGIGVGLFGALR